MTYCNTIIKLNITIHLALCQTHKEYVATVLEEYTAAKQQKLEEVIEIFHPSPRLFLLLFRKSN